MTSDVAALGREARFRLFQRVAAFEEFSIDNDPHGEHDCASVEFEGERVMFKIDYYDRHMLGHYTDPAVTERVLTLMFVEEY